MRFGNILFPSSWTADRDAPVIAETLEEARLSEAAGFDSIWLAEHHFSGQCVYTDPLMFGAAVAAVTKNALIGFAVIQAPLHFPIKLAEQIALLDNLAPGRLIIGLGRGARFALSEALLFGTEHAESQDRLEEIEQIVIHCLEGHRGERFQGKYFDLIIPDIRPRPVTLPRPAIVRAVSRDVSLQEVARQGQPFITSHKENADIRHQVELYRKTAREAGFDDASIAANLADSWVWRRVFVADSDAEAERVGVPLVEQMVRDRTASTNAGNAALGLVTPGGQTAGAGKREVCSYGAPDTVAEAMAELQEIGIGGVIAQFRIGEMPVELARHSLRLFVDKVRPQLGATRLKEAV